MRLKYNPFNPQQPAKPHFFVGRDEEVEDFQNFLVQTTKSSPMNMSITGDRGMGKTSILAKFEDIAKENECLVVRISNYEGNVRNFIEFSDFILTNIQTEIISRNILKKGFSSVSKLLKSLKPAVSWQDFSVSLEAKQLTQGLMRESLIKIWDATKKDYGAIVLLIDEAESLEALKVLTFMREIFQRVESVSNYMVVLAGKFNFPERMSESFSPLNRFFPVHKLNKLSVSECEFYLNGRLKETNVAISSEAAKMIYEKCEGHPYVLVIMGYLIFDSLISNELLIDKNVVLRTQAKIDNRLRQDFFYPMFHPLSPRAKMILCKIVQNVEKLDFSFKDAQKWTGVESNHLSPYIQELIRKGVINKPRRAEYSIFHSLFKEFLLGEAKNYEDW